MAYVITLLLLAFSTFNINAEQFITGKDWSTDIVKIDEDYEFYWDQYIPPNGEFSDPLIVDLPYDWDETFTTDGKGTFRTKILLERRRNIEMGIKMPFDEDLYSIYVNGKLIGTNYLDNGTRIGSGLFSLPNSNQLEIVIHISNYNDIHGGLASPPLIGSMSTLERETYRSMIFEAFLFGALFFSGLLYFSFYLSKRNEKAALFFSLFSIIVGFRAIIYGEHILLYLIPTLSVEWESTIGHLTYYLAVPLFVNFLAEEFYFHKSRFLVIFTNIVSFIYVIFAFVFNLKMLLQLLIYYQFFTLCIGVICFGVLVKRAINLNFKAIVTLCGFIILLITTINDILLAQEVIVSYHMTPFGMMAFVISQGILLSQSVAKSLSRSVKLALELTLANKSFKRFVPEEFLNILGKKRVFDIKHGDHVQLNMTVMFCDIRDFTSLSEQMSPADNFMFINSFLERVGPVIREYGGFIDKYMGDGFMALFPSGADTAVSAAISIHNTLKVYNTHRNNSGYKHIKLGIGINTGSLMLGTIGENERMDGTVISDTVNICSRIESITKEYGVNIAISEQTYSNIFNKSQLHIRHIGQIILRGKLKPVSVFEVFNNDLPESIKQKKYFRKGFEKGVQLFEDGDLKAAEIEFNKILMDFPKDMAAISYISKIKSYLNESNIIPNRNTKPNI